MNSTLLDLSGKVDPKIVDAVSAVSKAAEHLGIPFLIVGAASRDFLLQCAYGIRTGRATEDVDFGVRVISWEEYERLANLLETTSGFVRDKKKQHRFRAPNALLIDLVPFGPIAEPGRQVIWPPDYDRGMSVEGYDAAMNAGVDVLLRSNPRLVVKTASLSGLALLKLVSWDGSDPKRARDAHDFFVIMDSYMETAEIDRLSTDAQDLAREPIPPLQEIGARLLGRDIASMADASAAKRVAKVLNREKDENGPLRLVADMKRAAGPTTDADEILALVRAVARGFSEVVKQRAGIGPVQTPGPAHLDDGG